MESLSMLRWIFAVLTLMCGLCLIYINMPQLNRKINTSKITPDVMKPNNNIESWFLHGERTSSNWNMSSLTTSGKVSILWYNKPQWIQGIDALNRGLKKYCPIFNCSISDDITHVSKHSAVIFSLQDGLKQNDLLKKNRNPNQPWIFFHAESPIYIPNHATWYRHDQWLNTMNWSMSYRYDSDVYSPYSEFIPREVVKKNYSEIFRKKDKFAFIPKNVVQKNFSEIFRKKDRFAAWIVSHCNTQSKREIYVKKLQDLGVPVDIYGRCSGKSIINNGSYVNKLLESRYKFYLSFENSLCKDYITEKFYSHYDIDTIMIVRSGADYTKIVPNGTYINTKDFPTIKDLAQFLLRLNSSESLYTEYLERRNAVPFLFRQRSDQILMTHCYACEMVINSHKHTKWYNDIIPYVFHDTCRKPRDI